MRAQPHPPRALRAARGDRGVIVRMPVASIAGRSTRLRLAVGSSAPGRRPVTRTVGGAGCAIARQSAVLVGFWADAPLM